MKVIQFLYELLVFLLNERGKPQMMQAYTRTRVVLKHEHIYTVCDADYHEALSMKILDSNLRPSDTGKSKEREALHCLATYVPTVK